MMSGKPLYVWAVLVLIGSASFAVVTQEDQVIDLDEVSKVKIDVEVEKPIFNQKYEYKLKKIIDDKIKSGKNEEEIQLIIETDVFSENYIDSLKEQGVIVEKNYRNLVQVKVKVEDVEKLVKNNFIKKIKTPTVAYPDIVSQGVAVIGADALHALSITGEGVKVAVLDGSFLGYTALLGTELPSSVVIQSFHVGGIEAGGSHGTACAEIVHDVAPGASLYLVNFDSSISFYQAMDWLIAQDVDVISFSMSFFNAGPGDGTGSICDKVNEAESSGILFVKSAGNYAERHYEGYFQSGDLDEWHDFATEDELITIYAYVGDTIRLYLSWSASWPTNEDYDLWLLNSSVAVAASLNAQYPSGWNPVESISYDVDTEGWYYVGIEDYSTSASWELELFSTHNFYDHRVPSSSLAIPSGAVGSFTVGATYWGTDVIESFSSQGPTNDGRIKPDVSAPDGVSSFVYGGPFFGTSASTPHVAGAAALLLSYHPSFTVAQIKSSLGSGAIDYGTPGTDNLYGAGRIDVYESYVDIKYVVTLPVDFGTVIVGGTYIQTDVITAGGFGNTITITAAVQSGGKVDALEELRYVEGTVTGASGVPLIIWDEDDPVSSWTAITLDAGEQLSLEAYAGLASGTWGSIVITLTVS